MAKKKEAPTFQEIVDNKWPIEFKRKSIDKHSLFGFLIDYTEEFLMLNVIDRGNFFLNGYTVIRDRDVNIYRVYDDEKYFFNKVLKVKKVKPRPLKNISLEDWEDILATANEQFPLITVFREAISKGTCRIGKVQDTGNKKFSLYEIDPDGTWDKTYKYKYSDLTKVDFGGMYEAGLHLVSEYDNQARDAK